MTKCRECGLELPAADDPERRSAWPSCGATTRLFEMSFEDRVRVSDPFILEAQHDGRTVEFREWERGGCIINV